MTTSPGHESKVGSLAWGLSGWQRRDPIWANVVRVLAQVVDRFDHQGHGTGHARRARPGCALARRSASLCEMGRLASDSTTVQQASSALGATGNPRRTQPDSRLHHPRPDRQDGRTSLAVAAGTEPEGLTPRGPTSLYVAGNASKSVGSASLLPPNLTRARVSGARSSR